MIALKKPGRERRRFELHANALAFGLLAKEGVLANRRFEMFEMTTSGEIWVTVDNIPLTRARVASPRGGGGRRAYSLDIVGSGGARCSRRL